MFTDEMILYIGNYEESIKKLLELINKFSKAAVILQSTKLTYKSHLVFLYTENQLADNEIKKRILFKQCQKQLNRDKFNQVSENLNTENHKALVGKN